MTETVGVSLTDAAYTELAAGQATVLIWSVTGSCRVHIGASAPAAGTLHYFPIPGNEMFKASGLSGGDNVYARSEGATGTVKVLRK